MDYYKQVEIKDTIKYWAKRFKESRERSNEMTLELKNTINASIVYPKPGRMYDVTTNQGNIHKNIIFEGYSNGIAKPKYIFTKKDGEKISINPSYEVEMEEIAIDNLTEVL